MDPRLFEVSFGLRIRSYHISNLTTLLLSVQRAMRSRRNHPTRALPSSNDTGYPIQEINRDQTQSGILLPNG